MMSRATRFAAVWAVALSGVTACATGTRAPPAIPVAPSPGAGWVVVPGMKLVRAETEADCGAAALKMVLARWTPDADDKDVNQALGAVDSHNGYRAGMLRNVARARGLDAFVIEGKISDLVHEVQLGRPVIVGVVTTRLGHAYAHYQVVAGADATGRRLLIADPRGVWTQVGADELLEEWRPTGHVAVVVLPSQ